MHKILLALLLFLQSAHLLAEEVQVAHNGLKMNAYLEKVGDNWPAGPVVLLTHGTLAHGGMEMIKGLQSMLTERGFSSLAINLSLGLDDRRGMYDCATPHRHRHTDAVDEIGAWLDWLKGQGVEKVAILGHSRGGNQVARFAAGREDPAMALVILVAPQTWTAEGDAAAYEQRYGVALQPVLDRAQELKAGDEGSSLLDGVDFLYCDEASVSADAFLSYYAPEEDKDTPHVIPRIGTPVLVFAGTEDSAVKGLIEKTEPLADGDQVQLVVIDGADHFFRDLYSEDVADAIAEALEDR
jgi:pimeloyl-ACP methyl ester carboxylesterase